MRNGFHKAWNSSVNPDFFLIMIEKREQDYIGKSIFQDFSKDHLPFFLV